MLRDYQNDCLDSILREYVAGVRQMLVVMSTGLGKTVCFANLPGKMRHLLPGKVLVLAARLELIDQAIEKIKHWNPELKVGKEMAAARADVNCDVVVGCVPTLGRTDSERIQRFGEFDIVICDEAAHAIASTYMRVFEATGVLKPDTRKLLVGWTATPKRSNLKKTQQVTTLDDEDIISLKSVFQKIVYSFGTKKAIKLGWLVPIHGYRLKTEVDLSEVKTSAGDYQTGQLSEAVNTNLRNAQIVKTWKECAEGRSTVVFAVDIKHSQDLAAEFAKYGVRSAAVWGDDPLRAEKLAKLKSRELTVLVNCNVLVEGFDAWQVSCIVLARPTKSSSMFTQMIGRGLRLQDGTGNLLEATKAGMTLTKIDCRVVDVVDCSRRCNLVTLPSLLGLNPDFDLHGQSVTAAVEKIEALEEKNPGIDFKNLTDLSKVKAYIEALDLFADPFSADVKEHSKLMWMEQADGSYSISIPEEREVAERKEYYRYRHEKLVLAQNPLEEWELSITSVDPEKKLGVFNALPEAFTTADEVLQRCRPNRIKLLQREAPWHDSTASDAAKKYLRRLVGKKTFLYCTCPVGQLCSGVPSMPCGVCHKPQLTAGRVATAITKLKAKGK
jgi:superfamily II DNA or RNA helicase